MIKTASFCAGIGSPELAMRRLGIPHEIVFVKPVSESQLYKQIGNTNPNTVMMAIIDNLKHLL